MSSLLTFGLGGPARLLLTFGLGDHGEVPGGNDPVTVTITSSNPTIVAGESFNLTATVSGAKDQSVSWSIPNPVVQVNQSGVIELSSTITVRATSNEDPSAFDDVEVEVLSGSPSQPLARSGMLYAGTFGGNILWEPNSGISDRIIYSEISRILSDLQEFDAIIESLPENLDGALSQDGSVCVLIPSTDVRISRQPSQGRRLREVEYGIAIKFREARDPILAYDRLDRLNDVIHNALEGIAFGGFCLPDYSVVGQAKYDASQRPDYIAAVKATFAYVVDNATGYSVTLRGN